MILQFGLYLLQSVACFIVVARCGSAVLVESHHALSVGFNLCVFGFRCAQLHLIIHWVNLRNELSGLHIIAFAHQHTLQCAGYLERHIGLGGCYHMAGILQFHCPLGSSHSVDTHYGLLIGLLFCLVIAGYKQRQECRKNAEKYFIVHSQFVDSYYLRRQR